MEQGKWFAVAGVERVERSGRWEEKRSRLRGPQRGGERQRNGVWMRRRREMSIELLRRAGSREQLSRPSWKQGIRLQTAWTCPINTHYTVVVSYVSDGSSSSSIRATLSLDPQCYFWLYSLCIYFSVSLYRPIDLVLVSSLYLPDPTRRFALSSRPIPHRTSTILSSHARNFVILASSSVSSRLTNLLTFLLCSDGRCSVLLDNMTLVLWHRYLSVISVWQLPLTLTPTLNPVPD